MDYALKAINRPERSKIKILIFFLVISLTLILAWRLFLPIITRSVVEPKPVALWVLNTDSQKPDIVNYNGQQVYRYQVFDGTNTSIFVSRVDSSKFLPITDKNLRSSVVVYALSVPKWLTYLGVKPPSIADWPAHFYIRGLKI